jgi:hypothetical protein
MSQRDLHGAVLRALARRDAAAEFESDAPSTLPDLYPRLHLRSHPPTWHLVPPPSFIGKPARGEQARGGGARSELSLCRHWGREGWRRTGRAPWAAACTQGVWGE